MRADIARLHAQTTIFTRRVEQARDVIARALMVPNAPPYVALSGGKDSTVVYHLVREQMPAIPAVWSDDEWWLPETMEYICRLRESGLDVRQIRTNAHHTDWYEVNGDYNGIPDYARQQGWGLCFLGLREEESSKRRVHLRHFGSLYFAAIHDCWNCNPIFNWSWRDVWAYIVSRGLDYNRAYDRLEEIGIPPEYQRIGPLAVERVLRYGQIVILKRGWPDLYNRFVQAHPEVSTYT